jgi:hypothetical protein
VPVFLSVRLIDDLSGDLQVEDSTDAISKNLENQSKKNPIEHIYQYEKDAAGFAREFEESMVRF